MEAAFFKNRIGAVPIQKAAIPKGAMIYLALLQVRHVEVCILHVGIKPLAFMKIYRFPLNIFQGADIKLRARKAGAIQCLLTEVCIREDAITKGVEKVIRT